MDTLRKAYRWIEATDTRRRSVAIVGSLVTLALCCLVLVPWRSSLQGGTAGLVLLLPPLVASIGGLRIALGSALITAATLNVVFLHPYGSFALRSDTTVLAFVAYLAIAALLAVASGQLRQASRTDRQRAKEASLLRDITIDLVSESVWLELPLQTALADLHRELDLAAARISVSIGDSTTTVRAGDVERFSATAGRGEADGATWTCSFPIGTDTTRYGVLEIAADRPLSEQRVEMLASFANIVSLSCERSRLMADAVQRTALEATDRMRVSLMQSVTHDLRTPLTAISALAAALPQAGPLTEEQDGLLVDLQAETARLEHLVNQVLDLSRIESGMLRLNRASTQLGELVRAALGTPGLEGLAPFTTVHEDETAPTVQVDELLITQVIANLLGNAAEHGGAPYEVRIGRHSGRVELRVVDHGPGIPESERRRVFEKNYRVSRRAQSGVRRGTGLGLAISRGFVEAHHGHIRVEPTPGGGATIVVSLPQEQDRAR